MGSELALLFGAAGICTFVCVWASPIGRGLGVLDHPDKARKLHKRATPQVGGIAILSGLMIWIAAASMLGLASDKALVSTVLLCGTGVAVVGFSDDQVAMSPLSRLALLLVFVLVAFALDHEFLVPRLYSVTFMAIQIPLWMYLGLIVIASLGVVNAVNMADGQDGVAAGMFAVWSACLAYLTTGESQAIAAVLFVLCLVFLIFNLRSANKVFLGDCGSYGVTFIIGMLAVLAHARGQVPIETILVWFFIPVADCLRLLIMRASRGTSPFQADRDHFHHRLEDRLGKHRGLTCYLGAVAISSAISAVAPRWTPLCLCALSGFYFAFAFAFGEERVEQPLAKIETVRNGNVISIAGDRRGAG